MVENEKAPLLKRRYLVEFRYEPKHVPSVEMKFNQTFGSVMIHAGLVTVDCQLPDNPHDDAISGIKETIVTLLEFLSMKWTTPLHLRDCLCLRPFSESGEGLGPIITPEPAIIVTRATSPNVIVTNPDGSIDSRGGIVKFEELIRDGEWVMDNLSKDAIARSIMQSYARACNNPDHEFFHLYEIHDCLNDSLGKSCPRKYNKATFVQELLGLKVKELDEFKKICNNKEHRLSRHRGLNIGNPRRPTAQEQQAAWMLARRFIQAYFDWKRKSQQSP